MNPNRSVSRNLVWGFGLARIDAIDHNPFTSSIGPNVALRFVFASSVQQEPDQIHNTITATPFGLQVEVVWCLWTSIVRNIISPPHKWMRFGLWDSLDFVSVSAFCEAFRWWFSVKGKEVSSINESRVDWVNVNTYCTVRDESLTNIIPSWFFWFLLTKQCVFYMYCCLILRNLQKHSLWLTQLSPMVLTCIHSNRLKVRDWLSLSSNNATCSTGTDMGKSSLD